MKTKTKTKNKSKRKSHCYREITTDECSLENTEIASCRVSHWVYMSVFT